jgi:hypothetical protein
MSIDDEIGGTAAFCNALAILFIASDGERGMAPSVEQMLISVG